MSASSEFIVTASTVLPGGADDLGIGVMSSIWPEPVSDLAAGDAVLGGVGECLGSDGGVWRFDIPLPADAALGGSGGRPPLARPFRMVRVSARRCCALSCCCLPTRVRARVSMSLVSSSIRLCTMCGCGGIGGVTGRL